MFAYDKHLPVDVSGRLEMLVIAQLVLSTAIRLNWRRESLARKIIGNVLSQYEFN